MTKTIEYELIDHGIDHAQYFQGCGVAYTKFDNVATGCGSNFAEALDDCLEQIAQSWVPKDFTENLEAQIRVDENFQDAWPTKPNTDKYQDEEDSEMYYYLSIRYNV